MSHKPISSKTMANSKHLSLYFSIEYHVQLASLKIYILELNKSYPYFLFTPLMQICSGWKTSLFCPKWFCRPVFRCEAPLY